MTPEMIAARDAAILEASQVRLAGEYNLADYITDEAQAIQAAANADARVRATVAGYYAGTPVPTDPATPVDPAAPAAPTTTTPAAPAAPASPVPAAPAAPGTTPTTPTPAVTAPAPAGTPNTLNKVKAWMSRNPWIATVLGFFIAFAFASGFSEVLSGITGDASGSADFADAAWLNIVLTLALGVGLYMVISDAIKKWLGRTNAPTTT